MKKRSKISFVILGITLSILLIIVGGVYWCMVVIYLTKLKKLKQIQMMQEYGIYYLTFDNEKTV